MSEQCPHIVGASTCEICMEEEIVRLEAENARLRDAAREAYEVYAGSDGFIPETAPEAYQQRLLAQIAAILGEAMKQEGE